MRQLDDALRIPDHASDLAWDCFDLYLLAMDIEYCKPSAVERFKAKCDKVMETGGIERVVYRVVYYKSHCSIIQVYTTKPNHCDYITLDEAKSSVHCWQQNKISKLRRQIQNIENYQIFTTDWAQYDHL